MTNDRIWRLLARKLSGEASVTELEELSQLKRQFPQHEKTVEEVTNWWSLDPGADKEFLEATYLMHLERMQGKGIQFNTEPFATEINTETVADFDLKSAFPLRRLLAAVFLMVVLLVAWVWISPNKDGPLAGGSVKSTEVSTRNGARSNILLPDGTHVWLNSGSKITYNKDLDTGLLREVYLTGEAFFDVVKNAKRPFIIHTARMDIKVLGTRFNVKAYEEDITSETSLIKGSVEVFLKNNPERKYLLKPNQKLVLLNELPGQAAKGRAAVALSESALPFIELRPLTYIEGIATDVESSWTKNILSFEDEPFEEVAKKMERWYDVKFEFKNKGWEKHYLSGSFEKESLEQAMNALQFSTGFQYKIEGKTIVIN